VNLIAAGYRAEPVSTSLENALERLHAQIIEHAAAV
jgi:hypothetical protein